MQGAMTISLGCRLPATQCNLPEDYQRSTGFLLLGFAPYGVCKAATSQLRRWALAPPFHPCFLAVFSQNSGIFSVALSLEFPQISLSIFPLGITQHTNLWSPDFPQKNKFPLLSSYSAPGISNCNYNIKSLIRKAELSNAKIQIAIYKS